MYARIAVRTGFAAIGLMLLGGLVHAGAKRFDPVLVRSDFFQGSFGSTRNSPDGVTWLRCEINAGTSSTQVMCDAYDGNTVKSCFTTNSQIVTAVRALDAEDRIFVSFSGTKCTFISVSKSSDNEPKAP